MAERRAEEPSQEPPPPAAVGDGSGGMTQRLLPPAFADLEPLVAAWARPNEQARQANRVGADLETVHTFYRAMLPRMAAVFDYFERIGHGDLDRLAPEERRLFYLAASFYEASHPVEMKWRRTDIDDAFPLERLHFLPPSDRR
jgi:hypothetical protein